MPTFSHGELSSPIIGWALCGVKMPLSNVDSRPGMAPCGGVKPSTNTRVAQTLLPTSTGPLFPFTSLADIHLHWPPLALEFPSLALEWPSNHLFGGVAASPHFFGRIFPIHYWGLILPLFSYTVSIFFFVTRSNGPVVTHLNIYTLTLSDSSSYI